MLILNGYPRTLCVQQTGFYIVWWRQKQQENGATKITHKDGQDGAAKDVPSGKTVDYRTSGQAEMLSGGGN